MTQHTDTERADFEAWLAPEYSREKWHTGEYTDDTVFSMFAAWQAARRAPAAPVPQGWKLVPEWPTVQMSVAGDDVYREDGPDVFSSNTIYTRMLAAVPQPPEAAQSNSAEFDGIKTKAAPVQLPEPVAVVLSKFGTTCMFSSTTMRKGDKIYTEHQVLAILAQHGIKTK